MVKRAGDMSKYYLTFSLYSLTVALSFSQSLSVETDTTEIIDSIEKEVIQYPGKPLIMSLIIPGAGQYYTKSPLWKILGFMSIEIGSIVSWNHFIKNAEIERQNYQAYADDNWSLDNWVNNRYDSPGLSSSGDRLWSSFSSLQSLRGTHDLQLMISGNLANELNLSKVSSDSLENNLGWVLDPTNRSDVTVVRDRHFYENIGKYDQFVGGWSDARLEWYWEEKDVGDSIEIVIKTPMKNNYINQRYNSNRLLTAAKYSITALMFNHVISGIETVWSNQRKNAKQNEDNARVDTNFSLTYNPRNSLGVGGVKFSVFF